jgi:IS605 OrfB family transposase
LSERVLPVITDVARGMIGMDSNHSIFCWSRLGPSGRVLEYCTNELSESDTKEVRAAQIEKALRHMVDVARRCRLPIAIESLNLEGRKRGKNSRRLNRSLHGMPYRKIRAVLIRQPEPKWS